MSVAAGMAVMRAMFDAEVTAACGQMRAGAGEDLHLALFGDRRDHRLAYRLGPCGDVGWLRSQPVMYVAVE
jgi:hypothetical protein